VDVDFDLEGLEEKEKSQGQVATSRLIRLRGSRAMDMPISWARSRMGEGQGVGGERRGRKIVDGRNTKRPHYPV